MTRKQKQTVSYFKMDAETAKKLDKRIARQGFTSRGDFFTAVSHAALYGAELQNRVKKEEMLSDIQKLPETVSEWVKNTLPSLSEEQIQQELRVVINEMLYAVVAMKGVTVAHENTWETVREVLHDRIGIWVTESDIREAFTTFAVMNKTALERYREKQLADRRAEP